MAELELKIVTPQRVVYDDNVEVVVVKGIEGELGILPDHTPLVTPLKVSVMKIKKDSKMYKVAISGGGYMEVTPKSATIITDAAELPEEIDVSRAQSAKERAEERLKEDSSDIDFDRAESALKRALVRLGAVNGE